VLETDDEGILLQLREVFEHNESDIWSELPDHVKKGIEIAQKQVAEGNVRSHEEVMKKYAKYL